MNKTIFAALAALSFAAGCGSSGPNEFAGSYMGVGSTDNAFYAVEATVADDGTVTASLFVYDGLTPVPPGGEAFPGSDYGVIVDLSGEVDGETVTASGEDDEGNAYTVTGTFDAAGIFTGEIGEDGSVEHSYIAAAPFTGDEPVAVACGTYSRYTASAAGKGDPVDGNSMVLTNGTELFGAIVSFDNELSGYILGDLGEDVCGPLGTRPFCNPDVTGDFTGTDGGAPLEMTLDEASGATYMPDENPDYAMLYVSVTLEDGADMIDLSANTTTCHNWDVGD